MGNNRAITLVEILVATVLIGIVAVGMARVFVISKITTHKSADGILALGDARAKVLEKITEGLIKGEYNCAKNNEEAMTNYAGFITTAPASFGNLLNEEYQIDEGEICILQNGINYCYKPVQFTVEWEKRE